MLLVKFSYKTCADGCGTRSAKRCKNTTTGLAISVHLKICPFLSALKIATGLIFMMFYIQTISKNYLYIPILVLYKSNGCFFLKTNKLC